MINNCDFSLKHYISVLNDCKNNYVIGSIREYDKIKTKEQYILLRHDVDFSLDYALRMAEVEAKNDFRSTYFILLHSQHYNALSEKNSLIIKKIVDLGHDIGLHYDSRFLDYKNIIDEIKSEVRILENITKTKIISLAQHDVTITGMIQSRLSEEFIDARQDDIVKSTTYISDSVQNWRKGCMCMHMNKEKKIQILTHPIWWCERHMYRDIILEKFYEEENKKINENITAAKKHYTEYLNREGKK